MVDDAKVKVTTGSADYTCTYDIEMESARNLQGHSICTLQVFVD